MYSLALYHNCSPNKWRDGSYNMRFEIKCCLCATMLMMTMTLYDKRYCMVIEASKIFARPDLVTDHLFMFGIL